MTVRKFDVEVRATVTIAVDTDITTEEYGDALNPRRQDGIYNLETPEELLAHLAYNAVANQREDAVGLDGWADLPREAVCMVVEFDVDAHDVQERVASDA